MALSRKPIRTDGQSSGVDIDALINKGGSVATEVPPVDEAHDDAAFTLRVPRKLLQRLDAHLKNKPIKTPRQFWILEAVLEKLERESSG